MEDEKYLSYMGLAPKRIGSWEHWSNPAAATFITGIDYYETPASCMRKLNELYPFLQLYVPDSDKPLPRPEEQKDTGHGQWGGDYRESWQQGEAGHAFDSLEDMLTFSPLENADFSKWDIMGENRDYSSEDIIYKDFRSRYPSEWGDNAPQGSSASVFFYNTMFMWPLLVFGYENFMLLCMDPKFGRIMEEFAEINRRVFRAFCRLPVNFVVCHDDIVLPTGPVVSPAWMHKYIFPRYEEYWGMLKESGKEVIFMVDGCVDFFVDDVMACGARGIVSEPFTDFRSIASKYDNPVLAGEGDCRILMSEDKAEIKKMVERMVETAKMSGGYMMCVGNHIPYNVPPAAVKYYLDLCSEMAFRYE